MDKKNDFYLNLRILTIVNSFLKSLPQFANSVINSLFLSENRGYYIMSYFYFCE